MLDGRHFGLTMHATSVVARSAPLTRSARAGDVLGRIEISAAKDDTRVGRRTGLRVIWTRTPECSATPWQCDVAATVCCFGMTGIVYVSLPERRPDQRRRWQPTRATAPAR